MKTVIRLAFYSLLLYACYVLLSAMLSGGSKLPKALQEHADAAMQQYLCQLPISWRIGELDPAFSLTLDEAEQTAHFRVGRRGRNLFDVRFGDAFFFGDQQRIVGPANDVAPVVVAMAHDRAERFLGDDLRQDDVVFGIRQGGAAGGQTRSVGGVGVAGTGQILALRFRVVLHGDGGIADVVELEEVGQVQFGGGAGLDADGCAVQFLGRRNTEVLLHHEALTVVVVHRNEIELKVVIAREGPGRVADQHVNFARSQRGEAGLRGQRDELDLVLVAQNGSSDGLAKRSVKALIHAIGLGGGKAGQTGVRAADQLATRLHIVQSAGKSGACKHGGGSESAEEHGFFHSYLFLWVCPEGQGFTPRLSDRCGFCVAPKVPVSDIICHGLS